MDFLARTLSASIPIGFGVAFTALALRLFLSPGKRHAAAMAGLVLTVLLPPIWTSCATPGEAPFALVERQGVWVASWLGGVFLMMIRLLHSWWVLRSLVRGSQAACEELAGWAEKIASQLGLKRVPFVRVSDSLQSPLAIGVLRAVVLIPASFLANATPGQVQAILAHEFAHVKRWDYWANMVQLAVETLLFFHPAVWVLSWFARNDREVCCDEAAASIVGDRVEYARALVAAASLSHLGAPAASGGSLKFRLSRLLSVQCRFPLPPSSSLAGSSACMAMLACLLSGPKLPNIVFPHETLPPDWRAQASIQPESGNIEIRMQTRNGDGKIVLTQPDAKEPRTWFTLSDGRDTVKYQGERRGDSIVFTRS